MQSEQSPLVTRFGDSSRRPNRQLALIAAATLVWGLAMFVLSEHRSAIPFVRLRKPKLTGHNMDCNSKKFKSRTLKLVYEQTFASLFGTSPIRKYEASDITGHPEGNGLYVVIDNTFTLARVGSTLGKFAKGRLRSTQDALLTWSVDVSDDDSDFEYIAYNATSDLYIVGQEAVEMDDGKIRSRTFDVSFDDDRAVVHGSCITEFDFEYINKGFEGAAVVDVGGKSLLLGLCEGNFCKGGTAGQKSGNGRIVVMEREQEGDACLFKTIDIIKLPDEINFQDYSGIAVWNGSTVGIASQESAAIFVGVLRVKDKVKIGKGRIYDFPRNDNCEVKYCNIEGLYFLERDLVAVVSDSMKSKGRQHFRCREKDESVHVFQIPSL